MALDSGVGQRGIFIAAKGEHGLIHVSAVEDIQRYQQVEVIDGKAGY